MFYGPSSSLPFYVFFVGLEGKQFADVMFRGKGEEELRRQRSGGDEKMGRQTPDGKSLLPSSSSFLLYILHIVLPGKKRREGKTRLRGNIGKGAEGEGGPPRGEGEESDYYGWGEGKKAALVHASTQYVHAYTHDDVCAVWYG